MPSSSFPLPVGLRLVCNERAFSPRGGDSAQTDEGKCAEGVRSCCERCDNLACSLRCLPHVWYRQSLRSVLRDAHFPWHGSADRSIRQYRTACFSSESHQSPLFVLLWLTCRWRRQALGLKPWLQFVQSTCVYAMSSSRTQQTPLHDAFTTYPCVVHPSILGGTLVARETEPSATALPDRATSTTLRL